MDAVNRSAAPKFGTIGVATSKKMAIVGARINEKLAHLGADLRHSLFCALHPSVLRLAAKESNIAIKSVATGMLKLLFNLNSRIRSSRLILAASSRFASIFRFENINT